MERTQLFELMSELGLYGMKAVTSPLCLPNIRFLRFGASFISMMQADKDGQGHDFADAMYWSSVRRVFF